MGKFFNEKCRKCVYYAEENFCTHWKYDALNERMILCEAFEPKHHIANDSKKVGDNVNSPSHYNQGGIECVDAMKACVSGLNEMEAVCTFHALKYLWRWKHKNGAEDIRKCIWWLERLLKELDDEQPVP